MSVQNRPWLESLELECAQYFMYPVIKDRVQESDTCHVPLPSELQKDFKERISQLDLEEYFKGYDNVSKEYPVLTLVSNIWTKINAQMFHEPWDVLEKSLELEYQGKCVDYDIKHAWVKTFTPNQVNYLLTYLEKG
jgi:hypothetical protein